jgi:PPM family protein phosphatase
MMSLQVASSTDPGLLRHFNEDSVAVNSGLGLMVLADGMGGYQGAEMASALATSTITADLAQAKSADRITAVRNAIAAANGAILKAARRDPRYHGMGTTLVLVWFVEDRVVIAHIGDSRAYRLRGGRLEQLTVDHALLQEALAAGQISQDEARISRSRHLVTRALGVTEQVSPDLSEQEAQPGDIYLLCSDGLHDLVDQADIELTLNSAGANLPLAAKILVHMANDKGGYDNTSVILGKVQVRQGWRESILNWMRGRRGG